MVASIGTQLDQVIENSSLTASIRLYNLVSTDYLAAADTDRERNEDTIRVESEQFSNRQNVSFPSCTSKLLST
jgi:hypothetical protein